MFSLLPTYRHHRRRATFLRTYISFRFICIEQHVHIYTRTKQSAVSSACIVSLRMNEDGLGSGVTTFLNRGELPFRYVNAMHFCRLSRHYIRRLSYAAHVVVSVRLVISFAIRDPKGKKKQEENHFKHCIVRTHTHFEIVDFFLLCVCYLREKAIQIFRFAFDIFFSSDFMTE